MLTSSSSAPLPGHVNKPLQGLSQGDVRALQPVPTTYKGQLNVGTADGGVEMSTMPVDELRPVDNSTSTEHSQSQSQSQSHRSQDDSSEELSESQSSDHSDDESSEHESDNESSSVSHSQSEGQSKSSADKDEWSHSEV